MQKTLGDYPIDEKLIGKEFKKDVPSWLGHDIVYQIKDVYVNEKNKLKCLAVEILESNVVWLKKKVMEYVADLHKDDIEIV